MLFRRFGPPEMLGAGFRHGEPYFLFSGADQPRKMNEHERSRATRWKSCLSSADEWTSRSERLKMLNGESCGRRLFRLHTHELNRHRCGSRTVVPPEPSEHSFMCSGGIAVQFDARDQSRIGFRKTTFILGIGVICGLQNAGAGRTERTQFSFEGSDSA
jgi:hypothetical protein